MKLLPIEIKVVRGQRPLRTTWTVKELSAREQQVMAHLASGMRNVDIAKKLNLSFKTVATYRERICTKLRLENNAQITVAAIAAGLVVRDVPRDASDLAVDDCFFEALCAPDEPTTHNHGDKS